MYSNSGRYIRNIRLTKHPLGGTLFSGRVTGKQLLPPHVYLVPKTAVFNASKQLVKVSTTPVDLHE